MIESTRKIKYCRSIKKAIVKSQVNQMKERPTTKKKCKKELPEVRFELTHLSIMVNKFRELLGGVLASTSGTKINQWWAYKTIALDHSAILAFGLV